MLYSDWHQFKGPVRTVIKQPKSDRQITHFTQNISYVRIIDTHMIPVGDFIFVFLQKMMSSNTLIFYFSLRKKWRLGFSYK